MSFLTQAVIMVCFHIFVLQAKAQASSSLYNYTREEMLFISNSSIPSPSLFSLPSKTESSEERVFWAKESLSCVSRRGIEDGLYMAKVSLFFDIALKYLFNLSIPMNYLFWPLEIVYIALEEETPLNFAMRLCTFWATQWAIDRLAHIGEYLFYRHRL